MYRVTRLPNGLTLATAEMPHMASVSLGLWVAAGGRCEPAELNGVCHFIEHMVFKGTRRRSARQISQAVEGIGGYINAYTSEENTCFYSRARHDQLGALLDVLGDMILNSRFDRLDIDRERNVIKEEVAMYLDQPHVQVQELLNATLWPDQPLGRPLTGTPLSLDRLQRKQLLRFMGEHYVAPSTLLVAAGRVTHAQFLKAVAPLESRFIPGERPRYSPACAAQTRPHLNVCTKDVEQTQLALGVRTCSRHDNRRFALRLLNTILGENMSSRLFQVIREDRGLAYNISSSISFFDDTGDLVISAGLDTNKLPETLRLVLRELRNMTERAPTPAELRRARDYVLGQFDLSLEGTESQMMWLGEQLLGHGKITPPAQIKRSIARVTPGEIRRVANEFFHRDRLNLALVTPLKRGHALRAQLDRY
jgi:predicted Zn-dependent peptidase